MFDIIYYVIHVIVGEFHKVRSLWRSIFDTMRVDILHLTFSVILRVYFFKKKKKNNAHFKVINFIFLKIYIFLFKNNKKCI